MVAYTDISALNEDAITIQIANWLRMALPEGCGVPWTHFPAGELRKGRVGVKLKRMGTGKGWPDFQFLYKGLFIGVEIKRPKTKRNRAGVQSLEQKTREAEITGQNGYYHIAYSGTEVEGILRAHGLPLKARFV